MTRRITTALASSRGVFLAAVMAGSMCCLGFLGIGGSSHTVRAQFRDADGLVVGNEVRVAGVQAGTVTSVQVGSNPGSGSQYAQVEMTIDASQWPLHQGTRVAIKPKGVLSNVFVELDPGSVHNPSLGDTPFFPLNATQSPVSLGELNNVFTQSVRNAIRTQLQEGVIVFDNGGALDLNQTLANTNPLTLDAIPLTDVLAARSPQLDRLNYEFDKVSGDLAREDANLRPLITNLNITLGAIAARQTDLQQTLVHAVSVFGDLNQVVDNPTTQADLARIFQLGPVSLSCAQAVPTYLSPLIEAVNPYIRYGLNGNSTLTLDTLLADFVTATGFNIYGQSGPPNPPLPNGQAFPSGNALRVDALNPQATNPLYPLGNPNAPPLPIPHDSGGLTLNHHGYTNTTVNGKPAYVEQPPLSGFPTISGCTPPVGTP